MEKIWTFNDYIRLLNHQNSLVRRWAMTAICEKYPNRFVSEVAALTEDNDPFIVSKVSRYISEHEAVECAPRLLDVFLSESKPGFVRGNCIAAVGELGVEVDAELILERFEKCEDEDELCGILKYCGKIRKPEFHTLLRKTLDERERIFEKAYVFHALLEHRDVRDIHTAFDLLRSSNIRFENELADSLKAREISQDLSEADAEYEDYEETLDYISCVHPGAMISPDEITCISRYVANGDFSEALKMASVAAGELFRQRYPDEPAEPAIRDLYELDRMSSGMLDVVYERKDEFNAVDKTAAMNLAFSAMFSMRERGWLVPCFSPAVSSRDLKKALVNSGVYFPKYLQRKTADIVPVDVLISGLTDEYYTWGDIHTVTVLGRIGTRACVPVLIRIINETDSSEIIHDGACRALFAADSEGREEILWALENGAILDPYWAMHICKTLLHPRAYELAIEYWEKQEDPEALEIFAIALEEIGDSRGIEFLQNLYCRENAYLIGDSIETLCLLYDEDIPELREIRDLRKKEKERMDRFKSANILEFMQDFLLQENQWDWENNKRDLDEPAPQTVKRESPKIGRNDPCPCGSGKKYKKCCLGT